MHHAEYYRGLEAAQAALRGADAATPAARAAAVHEALAPLLADTPIASPPACARGCAHCCHLPVGVTFAEAARLCEAVAADPALTAAVRDAARATAALAWDDLRGRACPLLRDAACAVYAVRPLPCRALRSADADACAAALRGAADVPADDVAFLRGLGAAAALAGDRKPEGTRELRAALGAMLGCPDGRRAAAFAAVTPRDRPPSVG